MKLISGLILATALLTGCSGGGDKRDPTPEATATLDPEPVSTASPVVSCEPLYPDVGFPVMVGRAGDAACVIWKGPPGVPAQIFVQDGAYLPDQKPAFEMLYSAPSGSPFIFPQNSLPPFRGSDRCFDADTAFRVKVEDGKGNSLGAEAWNTCGRIVSLADGCSTWPGGGDMTALNRLTMPSGEERVCIMWPDAYANETGFRITLSYPRSGEKFVYLAPANTLEFFPPKADTDGLGTFENEFRRKDWSLEIIALTPDGERLVGSHAVQVG
jgi:hypothetical protein